MDTQVLRFKNVVRVIRKYKKKMDPKKILTFSSKTPSLKEILHHLEVLYIWVLEKQHFIIVLSLITLLDCEVDIFTQSLV